ncbi:hypothetical protein LOAG_01553 [Loa loa]|uniref:Uncharacterized protein n=1 Tax=Loa loa TaxID=7209 RepID=A0A1S0U963_LOALO|nr:hypothetical protein LOAG_01553 [Loa loa]EFO26928.1 hypothetical protein LOAG_01553 [Loa loa]
MRKSNAVPIGISVEKASIDDHRQSKNSLFQTKVFKLLFTSPPFKCYLRIMSQKLHFVSISQITFLFVDPWVPGIFEPFKRKVTVKANLCRNIDSKVGLKRLEIRPTKNRKVINKLFQYSYWMDAAIQK